MSVTTKVSITPELAIRIGALAEDYQDCSVEIAYDDKRAEHLWQVTFEGFDADEQIMSHRYTINDETGEATADTSLEGLV